MIEAALLGFAYWAADKVGGKIFESLTDSNPHSIDERFALRAKEAIELLESLYPEEYHAAIDLLLLQPEARHTLYRLAVQGEPVPNTAFDAFVNTHTLPAGFAGTLVQALHKIMANDEVLEKIIHHHELIAELRQSRKQFEPINRFVGRLNEKENFHRLRMRSFHMYLGTDYWNSLEAASQDEKTKLSVQFYAHIDKSIISKAIQNGIAIKPRTEFITINVDGEQEEQTLHAILAEAVSHSFSLIKVLTDDGGMGKSTFLYWIAKLFHEENHVFIIKNIDQDSMEALYRECTELFKADFKPVLFLVDDVAEADMAHAIGNLMDFMQELFEVHGKQAIFIVVDRKSRYQQRFGKNLDKRFAGRSQTILYQPVEKQKLFETIFDILSQKHPILLEFRVRREAEERYMTARVPSLSESLKNLLDLLALNHIEYDGYDWIEWNRFIEAHPEYGTLKNLFAQVVCFYQFGIKLPLAYFRDPHIRQTIINALGDSAHNRKPISLSEDNHSLTLNHEHVATWFLQDAKGRMMVREIFETFLANIHEEHSARLFRKIRKLVLHKSKELETSVLSDLIDAEKCLHIISAYLARPDITPDEKKKMSVEKALVLLHHFKREEDAIPLLEANYQSNHAKDQLARIYAKNPATYQKAFDTYMDILRNNGHYAILPLYRLLQVYKQQNITITYIQREEETDGFTFPFNSLENLLLPAQQRKDDVSENLDPFYIHELVKEYILDGRYDYAERFLGYIKNPKSITAECHYKLAQALGFTKENTVKKREHYLKAIEINNMLAPQPSINYNVEYAVFEFRVHKFTRSTQAFKKFLQKIHDPARKEWARNLYYAKLFFIRKLFFEDIPDKNNRDALETYLLNKFNDTATMVASSRPTITVMQGFLTLRTIAFHSRWLFRPIYFDCIKRMASCYIHNINKPWNSLNKSDNRRIAEELYDMAFKMAPWDREIQENMINNLEQTGILEKQEKALKLLKTILYHPQNHSSMLYRLKGNVHKSLGEPSEAFRYYEKAMELLVQDPSDAYYISNMCATLNNIANLICDCIEIGIEPEGYVLRNADTCCNSIEQLNAKFYFLGPTRERIHRLTTAHSGNIT